MGDKILTSDEVAELRGSHALAFDRRGFHRAIVPLCDSHEELRARLERAEGALKQSRAAMSRVLPQTRGILVIQDLESAIAAADAALGAAGERGNDPQP